MILAAMWVALQVFKENAFGSATVEVFSGARLIFGSSFPPFS